MSERLREITLDDRYATTPIMYHILPRSRLEEQLKKAHEQRGELLKMVYELKAQLDAVRSVIETETFEVPHTPVGTKAVWLNEIQQALGESNG